SSRGEVESRGASPGSCGPRSACAFLEGSGAGSAIRGPRARAQQVLARDEGERPMAGVAVA
ncbi:MAG: hypothetical protein ACK5W7_04050, partial [Gemmatimonadaceae bacterium]